MSKPIEIACHNLTQTDIRFFKAMLILANRKLEQPWQVVDEMSSGTSVVLVDMEHPASLRFCDEMKGRHTLVAFAPRPVAGMSWFLEKPVSNVDAVATLLHQIALEVDAVQKAAPESEVPSQEYPVESFATCLQEILQRGETTRLQIPALPALYILPEAHCYYMPVMHAKAFGPACRILCSSTRDSITTEDVSSVQLERETKEMQVYSLDTLIWTAALCAAQSSPPAEIDPYCSVSLHSWPNFTRLPHQPEHITLAAYLHRHSASPATAATDTRLALSAVLAFCNACLALGLLEYKHSLPPPKHEGLRTETIKLFGKIMNRLLRS